MKIKFKLLVESESMVSEATIATEDFVDHVFNLSAKEANDDRLAVRIPSLSNVVDSVEKTFATFS